MKKTETEVPARIAASGLTAEQLQDALRRMRRTIAERLTQSY